MHFNLIDIINIFTIASSMIIIPVLFINKIKGREILTGLLICVFFYKGSTFYYRYNPAQIYPHFLLVNTNISLLFGPLFYLYSQIMTNNLKTAKTKPVYHFLPAVIMFVLIIPLYLLPQDTIFSLIKNVTGIDQTTNPIHGFQVIIAIIIVSHIWTYLIISIKTISRYQEKIVNNFSNIDAINLIWLKHFIQGVMGFHVLMLCMAVLFIFNLILLETLITIIMIISSIIILGLVIRALMQPAVLFAYNLEDQSVKTQTSKEPSGRKYEKSSLKDNMAQEYADRLNELLIAEKLFTDETLTLADLADELNVSRNHLSQIINKQFGLSFYDFINKYRIEEAIKYLKDPAMISLGIMDIAYKCGFASKASFNRNFKDTTGLPPMKFRKKYINYIDDRIAV